MEVIIEVEAYMQVGEILIIVGKMEVVENWSLKL
jgi:hypothetical protein